MSAGLLNIVIEQGTTWSRDITIDDGVQPVASPVDLSDVSEVRGQIRSRSQSDDAYDFTLSVQDAANGEISWTMDANTTSQLTSSKMLYDIEVEYLDGTVSRLLEGSVTVKPQITR